MEKSSDHLHAVSNSDDERPYEETEFVIHVVDDHHLPSPPPPPPPPAPRRPHAFQPQPQALFVAVDDDKRILQGKKCSTCFVVRIVHCLLVMALAAVTVVLAARVPKEFADGSPPFIVTCPVLICILAFTWICFADYGDVDDDY
ncbi:hypothetical protein QYE76_042742 [Lolium multiflorum]|uniref:Transmembrane protein n=1 Tax=Lolium multiflorum TaxID=4521 RepID=A0AAD8TFU8_LOLMU|nr:hypothetical protein QYE76_042742 [Lolium multiflorum]